MYQVAITGNRIGCITSGGSITEFASPANGLSESITAVVILLVPEGVVPPLYTRWQRMTASNPWLIKLFEWELPLAVPVFAPR